MSQPLPNIPNFTEIAKRAGEANLNDAHPVIQRILELVNDETQREALADSLLNNTITLNYILAQALNLSAMSYYLGWLDGQREPRDARGDNALW